MTKIRKYIFIGFVVFVVGIILNWLILGYSVSRLLDIFENFDKGQQEPAQTIAAEQQVGEATAWIKPYIADLNAMRGIALQAATWKRRKATSSIYSRTDRRAIS